MFCVTTVINAYIQQPSSSLHCTFQYNKRAFFICLIYVFQTLVIPIVTLCLHSFTMSDPMPEIKSKHSLVAKYVTAPLWDKLSRAATTTSGFTLAKAIACAVQFDDQHCGIYAGDWDSYKV